MSTVEKLKKQAQEGGQQAKDTFNRTMSRVDGNRSVQNIKDGNFPGAEYLQKYHELLQDYPLATLFGTVQLSLFAVPIATFVVVMGSVIAGIALLAALWIIGILLLVGTILLTTLSILFFIGVAVWAWLASLYLAYRSISDVRQRGLQASLNTLESNVRSGIDQTHKTIKRQTGGAQTSVEDVKKEAEDVADDAQGKAKDIKDKVQDKAKDAKRAAGDKADDVKKDAKGLAQDGQERAKDVKKEGEQKAGEAKETAKDNVDAAASSA
jgi:hypothetical protein